MNLETSTLRQILSRDLIDTIIRIGLIVVLVVLCYRVVAPFVSLILWALILAVALYPAHQALARRLGGRQGTSASLIVLIAMLVIGLPTALLGGSFAGHLHDAYSAFQNDSMTMRKPDPAVAEWPIVGPQVNTLWNSAADDLPGFLGANKVPLEKLSRHAFSVAANTAGAIAVFLGSLIIAGIVMAYGEAGSDAIRRILWRLTDPDRGSRLQRLTTATIRSVATGVIGVAFIQALLLGIGFLAAGIPAAGVLAFIVLLVGIAQLPALIVSLPAIGYIWWTGDSSTTSNVVFSLYLIIAGMADNVLKPLLLGRGVDAPMPVILIGALGGMVTGGIIGLFAGAVVLAVSYQLFMEWIAVTAANTDEPGQPAAATGETPGSHASASG